MKSLADLEKIRQNAAQGVGIRKDDHGTRVVVGMATCGIAAGARPVMAAFTEEINKRNLAGVTVVQTGCIGVCRLEPIVEIIQDGKEKVTYVKMTPEKAQKVVVEHLVNGNVVNEYTIGNAE